ncbi:carbohydrate ABC transporter permease [Enterobacter kobei]|uniref:Sugar ABC transporter permease n=2 Tax=Enterobacter kobei TaxID=208224 RepID=A0ACC8S4I4_9ENTR|nr:carbohydrate ABC transporter permease [Enterobacter kobei]OLR18444.1 sugar ABC transporter permease [Enterobacter kobei]BCU54032.1 sugar ABC transporter permease [Enterobacter kobei]SIR61766.1 carbohydrate ABC transporter membrane protein 2, CUT1 family [Enterobacter kobei]
MKTLTPASLLLHAAMFLLALSWLYPFIWMVMASLKPTAQIYTTSLFAGDVSLANYQFLFDNSNRANKPFMRTLFNSLFVSLTITFCVTVTAMLVGYAVAKTDFRGKNAFKNLLIVQMVFPAFMFIIPQFILMRELGLINSYSAMILPYAMSAWGIFMVSQSFKGTPNDYIHAAKLDRASLWGILRHVMMPLNKSILAIVALFTFSTAWDNFLWPLIVMRDADKMPFSVLLATFSKSWGIYLGPVLAGSVVQMLPVMLLFILFRKYFLQGMSLSLK